MLPVYNPSPVDQVPATVFRQRLSEKIATVNKQKGALIVTVADCPRVVVADFTTYSELLYQANKNHNFA